MRLSVIDMGVHPEQLCSCGNPAHMGLADMNPVGSRGYNYKDYICSQCALELIAKISRSVRPERGMTKEELKKKNDRMREDLAKVGTKNDLLDKSYNVLTWLLQPGQPVAQLMDKYQRENLSDLAGKIKVEKNKGRKCKHGYPLGGCCLNEKEEDDV